MSATNASDPVSKSAAKKKKKSKKKGAGKAQDAPADSRVNGTGDGDQDDEDDEDETQDASRKGSIPNTTQDDDKPHIPSAPTAQDPQVEREDMPAENGAQQPSPQKDNETSTDHTPNQNAPTAESSSEAPSDTTSRLDAMQQERNTLRDEVTKLRQSLEDLQRQHTEEVSGVKEELEQTQQSREHAETQYRNLLGKVNTIRSQLGERLKADAEELEQARGKIDELESEKTSAREENERLQEQISSMNSRVDEQASEIENLRSRTNLSTTNWAKERDDMVSKEAYLREEYEVARQAMQDWEILATEERSRRETLEERVSDLEEQLGGSREAFERVKNEAETQGGTVDGLQRALRELQEERKRELRELVERSESQLDELRKQTTLAEENATALKQQLENTKKDLDRALPFEKEVKEKNLLIGKLRHEAVILNDHLTKALRFLKRAKPEDTVDRRLVTNHFLHFLALDRSDPKKFQVLQLIAALLAWDESQKEQAGLLRAGSGSAQSLKLPMSPFRRTPSTPSLSADFIPESPGGGGASRESLAELWSDFLEREAEAGGGGGASGPGSRRPSLAKNVRSPSMTSAGGMVSPRAERGGSPEARRTEKEKEKEGGGGNQNPAK
ncbi:hypothetical protein D0864_14025 [Hortaea werneckii]|uniref:GRIP domain-containing protein n=1 Tax=Hortaea werneckii TaxID=91943 RepID=A0A3M7GCA4_HORWE|nr:hypothetical protein KC323_g5556 [Hortaea werneckii]KAI6869969.1 hypothetical protein KC338_g3221 [Hortaea werneckii]KAI7351001.1 hypothetical protein KC320_g5256 [Hortaea werneckii]RMY53920.1 hypothetical protein D0864_14025 [Hortaea werneckii]RMY98799.1 hypothetical protein D0862_07422 [Hortaea werneckii]